MKNILGELNSRVKIAEGSIRELWEQNNRIQPILTIEIQQEKINRASGVCRIIAKYPTFISSESQDTEEKSGTDRLFKEVIDESAPNLVKYTTYKSRSCATPNRINPRKSMPRCIIVKHLKIRDKEKI